jgi:hypothetical protein
MDRLVTVMPEPEFRKPIFNFVWVRPLSTPSEQVRYVRVGHRGIIRLSVLTVGTLALTAFASITIAYLVSTRDPLTSIFLAAILATLAVGIFRGWILGTYVNDHGIKIIRMVTTDAIPWTFIRGIETATTVWRAVGIPLGLATSRVVIRQLDDSIKETHIYLGSIDGIMSASRLSMLESLINRWWRAE